MDTKNYRWKPDDEDAATRRRREEFEEWAGPRGIDLSWETMAFSKFYKSKTTRIAWMAWQAAATRGPLPTGVNQCVHCGALVQSGAYHTCAEMLEYRASETKRQQYARMVDQFGTILRTGGSL